MSRDSSPVLEYLLERRAVGGELTFQGATQERPGEAQGAGRLAVEPRSHRCVLGTGRGDRSRAPSQVRTR
jgi:hypothetical protein